MQTGADTIVLRRIVFRCSCVEPAGGTGQALPEQLPELLCGNFRHGLSQSAADEVKGFRGSPAVDLLQKGLTKPVLRCCEKGVAPAIRPAVFIQIVDEILVDDQGLHLKTGEAGVISFGDTGTGPGGF